jgi:hypothetical protein
MVCEASEAALAAGAALSVSGSDRESPGVVKNDSGTLRHGSRLVQPAEEKGYVYVKAP